MKKTLRKLSLRRETVTVLGLGRAAGAAAPVDDTGPGTCCCVTLATDIAGTYCCPPATDTGGTVGGTIGGGGGHDEVAY